MAVNKEEFKQRLKNKSLKVTTQRMLVLEVLSACPDRHLTAEEIYDLVKTDYPEIGLATVYRTIQLLLEMHLIDRINLDDGHVRYEIGDGETDEGKHHHHHLICKRCGKVDAFEDDLLEDLESRIQITTGFCVVDHEVKLYGYCKECGGKIV
ncbi:MAG TPA: Fur family transcriptional regulator [Lachnospiraceae bacterium]|nr:Fur family transcriptional regulator [Lachnospiraceae bacterium]